MDFAGTDKQIEILTCIRDAGVTGIEFHALKGALSYGAGVSNQAIQSSIRYLEMHGLVWRRYRKPRKLFLLLSPIGELELKRHR